MINEKVYVVDTIPRYGDSKGVYCVLEGKLIQFVYDAFRRECMGIIEIEGEYKRYSMYDIYKELPDYIKENLKKENV